MGPHLWCKFLDNNTRAFPKNQSKKIDKSGKHTFILLKNTQT